MDPSQITAAFAASLGSNNESRVQAHHFLESIKSTAGLIPELLRLSMSDQLGEMRLSSVIYLKNLTAKWNDSLRDYALPQADKETLRFNILDCLRLSVPSKIRSQFSEIAHNIAHTDFPWPSILTQLDEALDSNDKDRVFASLLMIQQISKVYEYIMNKKRENLNALVERYFPKLQALLEQLVTDPNNYSFSALIMQIYWICTYMDFPVTQRAPDVLHKWFTIFKFLIDQSLGTYEELSYGEIHPDPNWGPKRWAVQIFQRIFTRYYNVDNLQGHHKEIGVYYQNEWALSVLQSILPQLVTTNYNPDILANYFVKYVNQAAKFQPAFPYIAPVAGELLTNIIINNLQKVPEDEEIWRDNPIEYIRKEADLGQSYFHPKHSSIDLLVSLSNNGYLQQFMEFASSQLQGSPSLVRKEALLLAIGSLNRVILQQQTYIVEIQHLLNNYVLPDFDSNVGFLRARACWMYAQCAKFPFENPTHQETALEKICKLMVDSELPVRVEAAISLPRVLVWENSVKKIGNEVKQLLKVYLQIMDQIDSVDLVDALEEILGKFGSEILPYALEFTQFLIQGFMRMVEIDSDLDEGEGAMAAASTLNALGKIVDALEENEEELGKISLLLLPVLEYCLSKKGCEYFEEALSILACLLYYSPTGKFPHLFSLFQHIKLGIRDESGFEGYACEHIEGTCAVVGNYTQKYGDLILNNINEVTGLINQLFSGNVTEIAVSMKYLMILIENLSSLRDNLVNAYMGKVIETMKATQYRSVKNACFTVIVLSLGYSPVVTLNLISQDSAAEWIFQQLTQDIDHFSEPLHKKYVIFGVSALISLRQELPSFVMSNLTQLFSTVVKFAAQLRERRYQIKVDSMLLESVRGTEDEEDEDLGIYSETQDLYDSPVESSLGNEMLKSLVVELTKNDHEFSQGLVRSLDPQKQAYLLSILQANNN